MIEIRSSKLVSKHLIPELIIEHNLPTTSEYKVIEFAIVRTGTHEIVILHPQFSRTHEFESIVHHYGCREAQGFPIGNVYFYFFKVLIRKAERTDLQGLM